MLSVAQSANLLRVSPARVRALIKAGGIPAQKVGRAWCLREEDVLRRLSAHPGPGRPSDSSRRSSEQMQDLAAEKHENLLGGGSALQPSASTESARGQRLYEECRAMFGCVPSAELLSGAQSREEMSFYVAVSDFFLQQRQAVLVAEGVY